MSMACAYLSFYIALSDALKLSKHGLCGLYG